MINDVHKLMTDMRTWHHKLKEVEKQGQLQRVYEVGPTSFVQLIIARPVTIDTKGPVCWEYNQFWVDKAEPGIRDQIIGAYHNERLGWCKVMGIFEVALS